MFKRTTCLLAVCALGLTACDDSTTIPEDQLSDADAQFLALEIDAALFGAFDDYFATSSNGPSGVAAQADPVTRSYSFERSRDCPAGGTMAMVGEGTRTGDRDDGTASVVNTGTKTRTACARTRNDVTITVDGSGTFSHARQWLDREPTGTWTGSQAGELDWHKSTGESGSCSYSIASTVDTAANTRSVTGTFCGREIDRSGTWRGNG